VYLWDLDDGGFAGVVLFKKVLAPASSAESTGSWDSIHVFEASERGRQAHYKLTSTIMLNMVNKSKKQANEGEKKTSGEIGLSGSMTRQSEHDFPVQDPTSHITNTGRIIEDMEIKMRGLLQEVYFGKTKDVVYDLRSVEDLERTRRQRDLQKELVGFIKR